MVPGRCRHADPADRLPERIVAVEMRQTNASSPVTDEMALGDVPPAAINRRQPAGPTHQTERRRVYHTAGCQSVRPKNDSPYSSSTCMTNTVTVDCTSNRPESRSEGEVRGSLR